MDHFHDREDEVIVPAATEPAKPEDGDPKDWRSWKLGRETVFRVEEFGTVLEFKGKITEIHEDHLVCVADGMTLWVDDDTADEFY